MPDFVVVVGRNDFPLHIAIVVRVVGGSLGIPKMPPFHNRISGLVPKNSLDGDRERETAEHETFERFQTSHAKRDDRFLRVIALRPFAEAEACVSAQIRSRSPQGLGGLNPFKEFTCPFPLWLRESALRANVNDYWAPREAKYCRRFGCRGYVSGPSQKRSGAGKHFAALRFESANFLGSVSGHRRRNVAYGSPMVSRTSSARPIIPVIVGSVKPFKGFTSSFPLWILRAAASFPLCLRRIQIDGTWIAGCAPRLDIENRRS
jgi:hypothetical protein